MPSGLAVRVLVASALALAGCAGWAPSRSSEPAYEPALLPLGPSTLEAEMGFERRLLALRATPACASSPSYAVLEEEAPRGGTFLGFCDGLMVTRPESGGLIGSGEFRGAPEGWQPGSFALGGMWVRTELPSRVRVRSEGDGVRLVGKDVDLHVQAVSESEGAIAAPEGCALVASGSQFVICRRGGAHHVVARTTLGAQRVLVRSDPRMRATRRQADDMVRAVQLMHRSSGR